MSCETQREQGGKHILLKVAGALQNVTGAEATDIFTLVAHGLKVNDIVEFKSVTGGAGIAVDTLYFVISVASADTFQLSATKGGVALNFTTALTASTAYLYKPAGGIRAKSMSLNAESVDVTNEDSEEWRQLLDEAGVNSASLSGSGVFENGTVINQIMADLIARKNRPVILVMSKEYDMLKCCVKFTAFELSGEYNAESNYSISMESSGEVSSHLQA